MDKAHSKPRFLWRFSLAALLFLVACLAGFLSGYRVGHEKGAPEWNPPPIHIVIYDVADVTANGREIEESKLPTSDELVATIKSEVVPMAWKKAGGNGEIRTMPEDARLIVAAQPLAYEELADFLHALRNGTSP